MTRRDCLRDRSDPSHVFTCPACRADARIAAAWRTLGDPADQKSAIPVDEAFVAVALDRARRDRERARWRRAWLVAGAALLFSFFFGTSHERTTRTAVSADETYGSLVSPSALEELIPN
jgi:predicted anti-sigma-YlaC factor YlaD